MSTIRTVRSSRSLVVTACTAVALLCNACDGWTLDYGTPAAQFEARDARHFAGDYRGRKVTVRGVVSAVDVSEPACCVVTLEHGVVGLFGARRAAAEEYAVGATVYLDGIVASVDATTVTLEPVTGRDPTARYEPLER